MQYYDELKWCESCQKYVNYLLSLKGSYCIDCGAEVTLFSKQDMKDFKKSLERKPPVPRGRRKKKPSPTDG